MSLHTLTIHQLREKLRRGNVSAREATQSLLDRIQSVDGKLKAGDTTFTAGKLGAKKVVGDNVLLGDILVFTKENIDQFNF